MGTPAKFILVFALFFCVSESEAQKLRLQKQGTGENRISIGLGELVDIEVFADLQGMEAAGISLFITVPDSAFEVVDQEPDLEGLQPFAGGALFAGALLGANLLLPEDSPVAQIFPGQQLEYAAVLGAGSDRVRTGSGVVATFRLRCVQVIEAGQITVEDNPARETRLHLSDGITEQRFRSISGMEITGTGIRLQDVPDVILAPGKPDNLAIGSLNDYLADTPFPAAAIRWSFLPTDLDSLEVDIDPVTRRVRLIPAPGWLGPQNVIWIATEPEPRLPGMTPLSAADVSTVFVNRSPYFLVAPGPDGVKRDTVRVNEDEYVFRRLSGKLHLSRQKSAAPSRFQQEAGEGDPGLPLHWRDLDEMVEDPDIEDPQDELDFDSEMYAEPASSQVRGMVDSLTHELLVWTLADFAGQDSLRIRVRDGLGGEDSLRVIVDVEAENDPPRFTLEDTVAAMPRGWHVTYWLAETVEDLDTPLDSLAFSWADDPAGRFSVDTTRAVAGLEVIVQAVGDFVGEGQVVWRIEDPDDPVALADELLLPCRTYPVSPPEVVVPAIRFCLQTGGLWVFEELDDKVVDPDSAPEELTWRASGEYQTAIQVDQDRRLRLAAPIGFVGYEEVFLVATDPHAQSDSLELRIFASDGTPVIATIPDLTISWGEVSDEIVLDEYHCDTDDPSEDLFWDTLDTFDPDDLRVRIDSTEHRAELRVPVTAGFENQIVVFRATDPQGRFGVDTLQVTIEPSFAVLVPPELRVPVQEHAQVLDLDTCVAPVGYPVEWEVVEESSRHTIARLGEGNVLSVFGLEVGADTLRIVARDTLEETRFARTVIEVVDEPPDLDIPDVSFVLGWTFTSDTLNTYIANRAAHPDSLIEWSWEPLGPLGEIAAAINSQNRLVATAADTGTAQVVIIARNVVYETVGRDTVRITVWRDDCTLEFDPVFFLVGGSATDTLDARLPERFGTVESAPGARWRVSGAGSTLPVIDPEPPHVVRLSGVGENVGTDTLTFTVELEGGFRCIGEMPVMVSAKPDSVLFLELVPHPLDPLFIDLFVLAVEELSASPVVIRTFGASDSTVTIRQIEDDLEADGAFIWTGSTYLPPDTDGTALFRVRAVTAMGADVTDTARVSFATAKAGKGLVVGHGAARLKLPADGVPSGTAVLLLEGESGFPNVTGERERTSVGSELMLLKNVRMFPEDQRLARPGTLEVKAGGTRRDGVYRRADSGWEFVAPVGRRVVVDRLGWYAVLRDSTSPRTRVLAEPGEGKEELVVAVADGGSGVDVEGINVSLDGESASWSFADGNLHWRASEPLGPGRHTLELRVRDRAGNEAVRRVEFAVAARDALPRATELGRNFPNPFNAGTTIPFAVAPVADAPGGEIGVRLAVYDISGQLIRELVDWRMAPGYRQAVWDGCDVEGRPVGSGVYIYRLETPDRVLSRRMTLLK